MIGIDVVSISRIEKVLEEHDERFLSRYLNSNEKKLVKSPKTAAGFWAVKEAVSKALGCGIGKELSFYDIEISKTKKGAPVATLREKAKELHKIDSLHISITHDENLAIAVCHGVKSV